MDENLIYTIVAALVVCLLASFVVSRFGKTVTSRKAILLISFFVLGSLVAAAPFLINTLDSSFEYDDEQYEQDTILLVGTMAGVVAVCYLIYSRSGETSGDNSLSPLDVNVRMMDLGDKTKADTPREVDVPRDPPPLTNIFHPLPKDYLTRVVATMSDEEINEQVSLIAEVLSRGKKGA